ncbi:hypothetical protein KY290_019865 [Solanum tuberosum]|uniref:Retrovirus-related Pol polyprotein from transposon TNT 1-94-like beta-barrel domain-containing protein n=1 Tax=Solanum tuberosum TaxID=4113 RepID=A0ABQ7VKH0_SOLTU|nr:hypothetical protein KY290_019865 [Solanum tuberosum]
MVSEQGPSHPMLGPPKSKLPTHQMLSTGRESSRSFVEDLTASQCIWKIVALFTLQFRSCITISAYRSSSMAPDQTSEIPTNTAQSGTMVIDAHHPLYLQACDTPVANLARGVSNQHNGGHMDFPSGSVVDGQGPFTTGIGNTNAGRSQMQQRSSQPSSSTGMSYPGSSPALMTNLQPYPYPSTPWAYPPTPQQYMQSSQSIDQENGRTNTKTTMKATGMTNSPTQVPVDAKWIIDSGASKHMVNNSNLLTKFTSIHASQEGRVHLPTGSLAKVVNTGSSQILGRVGSEMVKHTWDIIFRPLGLNIGHIINASYHLAVVETTTQRISSINFYSDDSVRAEKFGKQGGDVYLGKSPNSDAPCANGIFRYNSDVGPSGTPVRFIGSSSHFGQVGDYDASLGTMLLETGGTIGQADSSWFKIVKSSQFGYNLLYCPVTSTMSCPFSSDDQFCLKVGVVHQNGKRRLALVKDNPLDVSFKQVQ